MSFLLSCNAMAGPLELETGAAPATVLESEGMGRERMARGFRFGDSRYGRGLDCGRPRAAIVVAMVARGELCSSRRGKDTAWGMFRRVWGCSPREELDQDGLGEEMDDALFFG